MGKDQQEQSEIKVFDAGEALSEVTETEAFAYKLMKQAASLKAVKIDRAKFLRTELQKHCPEIDIDLAVSETPSAAGVTAREMDEIALAAIDFESKKCAGLSFLAGIPGGIALAGTVPADLAQYFCHVMRVEQKLAYIYGWQSFLNGTDEIDDETLMKLIVLMGVMLQVGGAANAVNAFASKVAQQGVQKAIQKQALTKTAFYPLAKSVLKLVGVQLTKETFAKTVSKVVPVVGGVVSGGLTYATFKPASENLRQHLRTLPMSGIDPSEPDYGKKDLLSEAAETLTPVTDKASNVARTAGKAISKGAAATGKTFAQGAKTVSGFLGSLGKRS